MAKPHVREKALDPITFEVLRRSFEYISERMGQVLQKASFSPIIYDMVDYSNAIFDPNVELVGQTANCPVHLAAMHHSARAAIAAFPDLGPGDVVILNDPYRGGTHTPDVTLTMPIYYEDTLLGYGVSRAHWTDVGGNFDTHVAGEGLRLPPMCLYRKGQPNRELIEIIKSNTRTPQYVEGDLQAQMGALLIARDELIRLARKYGPETVLQGMQEVLDYTERLTRLAINEIPDGIYEGEDYIDSDGVSPNPVRVKVKLIIAGDELTVDLSESDPVCIGPVNSPFANTASAVYYALKFFLNPDAPANAGMYRPITICIPEGTWVNPTWPAPTLACTTAASSKICAAIWKALALAIPDKIVAPTYAECNWFVASVRDPRSGQVYVFSDLPAGGWGGTPFSDGMSVTMDPLGNCQNLPAETAELLFPVRYSSYEMRCDSGGPGKNRGGVGVRLKIEFLGRGELIWLETSRTREGSPGVNGGKCSPPQRLLREKANGEVEAIGGLRDDGVWLPQILGGVAFEPGESFIFETTGGGGWGDPFERDPNQVLEDVRNGLVSREAALREYGVAITDDLQIDWNETERIRHTSPSTN